jgi:murein DD-endopeptidase MepM/ murein hydrolase activator NlpD
VIFPLPAGFPYTICGVFGDPRANGTRTHQGVDLCCAKGTPLLAVADGLLNQAQDPLGGTTSGLTVADGSHYYYAHLSAYAPGAVPRRVSAGDVIGYVGSTGDAQAALPHLHFGHYVGGVAVNPIAELEDAVVVPLPSSRRSAAPVILALLATGVLGAGAVYAFSR